MLPRISHDVEQHHSIFWRRRSRVWMRARRAGWAGWDGWTQRATRKAIWGALWLARHARLEEAFSTWTAVVRGVESPTDTALRSLCGTGGTACRRGCDTGHRAVAVEIASRVAARLCCRAVHRSFWQAQSSGRVHRHCCCHVEFTIRKTIQRCARHTRATAAAARIKPRINRLGSELGIKLI